MKFLVIGDSGSMHIYNYIKTVLLPAGHQVSVLTLSTQPIRESFLHFYKKNGVEVYSLAEKGYKGLNNTSLPFRILNLWRKTRLMKSVPQMDVCHVHSVYKTSLMLVLKNKRKFKKLILSYWGSDIRDKSEATLELREKCFQISDAITVTVEKMLNDFRELHGNKYDDKLSICRFATDGLNCIKSIAHSNTREDCRKEYDVPEGKVVVTCGYSATPEQHQDEILEELIKLPAELRQKIYAIIPMQYGRNNKQYIDRVEELCDRADFDTKILSEFVPFEMSAKLAIATDIYLHMRDTDAFSNALKEHVFAGSEIIMGDWLKYIELEKMGADFVSVSSFDEMRNELELKLREYKMKDEINLFTPIFDLYSTESIIEQWKAVIDFAVNNGKENL